MFLLPYLPYIFGRIKIIIFFTVRTFNLEKIINILVSEYLRTPKNYQTSRVFTGMYAVTFPYIPIGVKINSLFNYMLFYQLELCKINLHDDLSNCFFNCMRTAWTGRVRFLVHRGSAACLLRAVNKGQKVALRPNNFTAKQSLSLRFSD